jgi:hypothetical protein
VRLLTASLLLLVLTLAGSAQGDAPDRIASVLRIRLDSDLVRENRVLRVKLGKAQRANRFHARIVRRLRAANRERVSLGASGVVAGFLCIHRFEGAWNDTGAPFWGGLQMDGSFQSTYGANFLRKLGTADHWPPFVQMAVAMSAYYSGRGFYPWPNTGRYCGLL